jgi:hypothetical protein
MWIFVGEKPDAPTHCNDDNLHCQGLFQFS